MLRLLCLAAALNLAAGSALAQTAPAKQPPAKAKKAKKDPAAATPPTSTKTGEQGTTAAPAQADTPSAGTSSSAAPAAAAPTPTPRALDQEEFRRQVMEEVRRELQRMKDEVKQETAWVEQDSQARVQDSEAVDSLKQRVNLFQPHGYVRMRGEFFYNMRLSRGSDPAGFYLFPGPFIGTPDSNKSQSDVNFRFRFEPTLAVSEDLSIYFQAHILDNILVGSSPVTDAYLDPFAPVSLLAARHGAGAVDVKRVWAKVNTQLGELVFGRMGYHWGLGVLHNDGNCLDCDYGDTYDRIAFSPREIKGHRFSLMFDIIAKGASTTGEKGELGRTVDLDTLDDGYRLGLEITHVDTPEEVKRKLDANKWVINYGVLGDYRTQPWDTVVPVNSGGSLRSQVVQRQAKFYQPDGYLSLKRKKWRFDLELAFNIGNVGTHQQTEFDPSTVTAEVASLLTKPVSFFQVGGAMQTDIALLSADALLFGLEFGAASGDKGAYGFGARPWRNGSGAPQAAAPGQQPWNAAGRGDIDGGHLNFSSTSGGHTRINNFMFNRSFNVDMILFRNLITTVTSAWYLKPSIRYRPTGRKTGGGDDTGSEVLFAAIYSQAWYPENTPGLAKSLGLEFNVGITYDTSDRLHAGLAYGLLLPFDGLRNTLPPLSPSVAHAMRMILAIPF